MIISGWSKQTNLMKQPWIFGEPYTSYNRKYLKLKMRLTPYIYTYSREAHETGVPTVRAMVLEFPGDPATWSKRTQYQFMSGEWLLVAPVYQDSIIRDDIYLPAGKWIDYWDGTEINGPTVLNGYPAPLDKLPMFVKAGAIIPMYPEMLYDRERPKDPVTLDVYPFGASSFNLYEDDGATQAYRKEEFARTLIEVESPKSLDEPSAQISIRVGAAKGKYDGMPERRSYVVDVHIPARPASVRLGTRQLPAYEKRAEFDGAAEGTFFDARDRRGVLHVKTGPQSLAGGFTLRIVQ
jgi:alpha-glucosidase (family GH31 glycosyl hydrolase)